MIKICVFAFVGTKSSQDSAAYDYENKKSIDNITYDQSSTVVTSPSKVARYCTLLAVM